MLFLILLSSIFAGPNAFALPSMSIHASDSKLVLKILPDTKTLGSQLVTVLEKPSHSGVDGSGRILQTEETVVYSGIPDNGAFTIPRFDGARDRAFSMFQIRVAEHASHYQSITTMDAAKSTRPRSVKSKKGITCVVDTPSSQSNSFPRLNHNIDIADLLANAPADSPFNATADGKRFPLNPRAIRSLDDAFQRAKRNNQEVTGILLAIQRKSNPLPPHIVHPLASADTVPIGPSAFDTATQEGLLRYRAAITWLVQRYGDPEAPGGSLEGLVIGNEIQSHWSWYHMGEASRHLVLEEYCIALRNAYLCSRLLVNDFRIYVSLDHHWAQSASTNPLRGFGGKEALEIINSKIASQGNFPWGIAHHPYPENLFKPAFWNDRQATLDFNSPKITFKNIEVLPSFLRQPAFLIHGKPRDIALTEQGFHCSNQPDGLAIQSAAFALAWKKVQRIPEIVSFLYHRHVDHPNENGLRCGAFAHDGSVNPSAVGNRRPILDYLEAADTPAEETVFAPALGVLGRSDWENLLKPVNPTAELSAENGREIPLVQLVDLLPSATATNLADVSEKRAHHPTGRISTGIQTHPNASGLGSLSFRIPLPDFPANEFHPLLSLKTRINNPMSTGGTFFIAINENTIFKHETVAMEEHPVQIDLRRWAGQTVRIRLSVDPGKDSSYDWMVWDEPVILLKSSHKPQKLLQSGLSALER